MRERNEGSKGIHSLPGCDGGVIHGRKKRRREREAERRGEGRAAPGPRSERVRVRVWDTTGIVNQETRQRDREGRSTGRAVASPHPACDASPSSPRERERRRATQIYHVVTHKNSEHSPPALLAALLPVLALQLVPILECGRRGVVFVSDRLSRPLQHRISLHIKMFVWTEKNVVMHW